MLKKLLDFLPTTKYNNYELIPEGVWASDITDPEIRELVKQNYQRRFLKPQPDPITHPWLFDPFDPPPGWKYDPYYEWWSKE